MEFRVLGSLEVVTEGRSLVLGGAKQRALLAVLLMHANRVVSTDRLIDALWGEQAPEGAAHTLQVYVSQLRKALRVPGSPLPETVLVTQGRGYLLHVQADAVDLHRFERTVGEGRRAIAAGEPERAAETLREALDLWRGPPFGEFAHQAFAQPEIARIEDLWLSAVEDRIEADLALGRQGELVGELQALAAEHPFRERLRAHLMLALYRSGRQAEALAVYRDARQLLADELGIDPSPDLQRLERAILEQDPELDVAATRASFPGSVAPPRQPRRRAVAVALVAIAVLGTATVAVVVQNSGSRPVVPPVEADTVVRIDPDSGRLVAAIPTAGTAPTALVWFEDALWVANTASRTVARIDPVSERVVQTVPTDGAPTAMAAGGGVVWVLNGLSGTVQEIDPRTNDITVTIEVPAGSGGIAYGAGAVWVSNTLDATVTRIDPQTEEIAATIPLGEAGAASPGAIAAGDADVWVGDSLSPLLWRIDAGSGLVVSSPGLRGAATAIAIGEGAVWVASRSADLVSRVDPRTGLSSTVGIGGAPAGIAVSNGSVWVTSGADGTVHRIDAATVRVADTIDVGASPEGIVIGDGDVWVTVHA